MSEVKSFLKKAESKAFDESHRQKINFNINKYIETVKKGQTQYTDLETARKKAKSVKWKAITNLDTYLLEFEKKFTGNGGQVIWANTEKEALDAITDIARAADAKSVVKSKSMATEEIELNNHLEQHNIQVHETDLGEYIVQLAGEKPYHIVTPAMHKSKEDVAKLFSEKLGTPKNATPEELTLTARKELRPKYITADIGITGANFIIADVGGIAITENEGNARLTITFPKIHIAIVGIEKMIPSASDLALFWPLLATYGTGQKMTVYNTLITGPKKNQEVDGPDEMYVILLDNGRSNLLSDPKVRESAYCIRCGACLNVCPVYKNIGGHTYNTTYSGPIGSVITPHLKGMEEYQHLSFASSLCGRCTTSCPVKIDLHNLLLYNRKLATDQHGSAADKWMWTFWKRGMLKRSLMNMGGRGIKRLGFRLLYKKSWGKRKEMPEFPGKSFNQAWKYQQSKKR